MLLFLHTSQVNYKCITGDLQQDNAPSACSKDIDLTTLLAAFGTYTWAAPIPHICHFFTHAKFLENKIYTEIHSKLLCITVYYCVLHSKYTVNCQFFVLNL